MFDRRDEWLAITDEFHAAAIDNSRWYPALAALASATGSRCGQLLGIGASAAVPFNIATNIDPAALRAFSESGRADPKINPRVKVGIESAILQINTEAEFLTAEEHDRHPHYEEFARPWDIPYSCFTLLERRDDLAIGLTVLRSKHEGPILAEQRQRFTSVAPHVRAAVRTQLALENHGPALLTGCMEVLSIPLFICDGSSRVQAMTQSAEELVRGAQGLQLKAGKLQTSELKSTAELTGAIGIAASSRRSDIPADISVVVRSAKNSASRLVLDVVALPSLQYGFNFAPRVMVKVRQGRKSEHEHAAMLQAAYDLTVAETEVALQLSNGKPAEAIAMSRGVAIGTVRAQIKTLLAKVGTNRQVELVALLNQI